MFNLGMATDNTTQESRNETIQILVLCPQYQEVQNLPNSALWADVVENGAVLAVDFPYAWYLVVDIPGECKFCGSRLSYLTGYCSGECHTRDKQGERL